MKRLVLSILSLLVIAVGGTRLAAQSIQTPWETCFNACLVVHTYDYCRGDCKVFEPHEAESLE